VNSETHQAVRRAAIKIYAPKEEWNEFTDGEGRFRFPELIRGEYALIAHRDGYTDRAYKVEGSDFDERKELPIELRPQGVIAGRVVNGLGQTLKSAQIQAFGSRTRGGKTEVISSTETNDLGDYRLSGLDPGSYQLRATYREGRGSEFDPTPLTTASSYYGGAEKPSEIAVRVGSLTSGIDFTLNPVRPVTVRGTLHTEAGVLPDAVTMWITGLDGEGGHNASGRDGAFAIGDVSPGTYTISAETQNNTTPRFGIATIVVRDEDVDAIDLVLRPIPKIDAEVRVEGGVPGDLKLGSIFFTRTDRVALMNMQIGHPDKDGKFTIALIPGEYNLSFDASLIKLGVQRASLDDKSITNWRLKIDESPGARKLVIVTGAKTQQ
jgi:hypothetical protein